MSLLYVGVEQTRTPAGSYATPAGLCTDLPRILAGATECAADTIILDVPPVEGGPEQLAAALAAEGWTNVSRTPQEGWLTIVNPGVVRSNLAVRVWCPRDPIIGPDVPAAKMIATLTAWQREFIEPYRMTPGVSLSAMMFGMVGGKTRPRLQNPASAEWWQPPGQISDMRIGGRAPVGQLLHRWDMRAAYLAAAAAVNLPLRQLEHTGSMPAWGPGAAGYYRVKSSNPALGKPDRQGCTWITHPILDYAGWQSGDPLDFEVVDSWTTPTSSRILKGWAERIRDRLYHPRPSVPVDIIKQGYTSAVGLLNVPRGLMYRPDWRHMIIDQVRASLIRRLESVARLMEGLEPVRVDVDSVWYDTNDPEHVGRAIGEGDLMGRMRYEGPGRFQRNGKRLEWTPA